MMFVLRMAWRETRASWTRLMFFFFCVALGVAAIVLLRSVVQNVRIALTREARTIIGADLVVQSPRAWSDATMATLDRLLGAAGVSVRTQLVETVTMASVPDAQDGLGMVRLVELRAVEAPFPLYGSIELVGGLPYSHDLLAGHGLLVQPELLTTLGVKVGDTLRIAGQPFTIRGVVARDRMQRSGGFSFGSRVYVDLADLRSTSLLAFGSRATRQILVRVDDTRVERLAQRLRNAFKSDVITVRSWQGVEDRLGRNLSVAENYLSLVGFAIVVLGGIGVWSVTRVLVQQKIKSVAILKCLGATSGRILGAYVLQVLWLAACGSALGVVMAAVAIAAIPPSLLEPLGLSGARVTASAAGQGIMVGLLVSLLFALVPLLEVRRVKPLLLLRADTATTARRRDWRSWLAGAVTLSSLVLVAAWQADSLRVGLYVSMGFAVVGGVLAGVSRLLVRAVAPLARSRRFALRHAVMSLGRPGNQTRVILMTVGLGCFFVLSVRALQLNLVESFSLEVGKNAPDMVLIDVQRDQVEAVRAAAAPFVTVAPRLLPLLRARVVGLDGQRKHLPTAEDIRRQGDLTREYGMTYRDAPEKNERMVAGEFWSGPLTDARTADGLDTEVSIEQSIHTQASVDVGDVLRFDVAGRVLAARVTSIRKVTWDQTQNGGFMFVLRPGPAIDRTPQSFIGFLQTKPDAESRGRVQRDLVRAFPNVSIIDVRDVLSSIEDVMSHAATAVSVVGAVTLGGGVLILIGAVAMTKFQRLYETAIYRTLGASTRMLASMVAIEYGLLGALAGLLGAAGALGLSWAVATQLFDIEWRPSPGLLSMGVALSTLAVSIVGLAASADVLVRKPLATLRSE